MIKIYLEGVAAGTSSPGGWAASIYDEDRFTMCDHSGSAVNTTQARMVLTAFAAALTHLPRKDDEIIIYCRSAYIINVLRAGSVEEWKNNNWKKANGTGIPEKDLWDEILNLLSGLPKEPEYRLIIPIQDAMPLESSNIRHCNSLAIQQAENALYKSKGLSGTWNEYIITMRVCTKEVEDPCSIFKNPLFKDSNLRHLETLCVNHLPKPEIIDHDREEAIIRHAACLHKQGVRQKHTHSYIGGHGK